MWNVCNLIDIKKSTKITMFKSFVVSQKSQKQNLSEQHHLIARAMNGLTSDRYKTVSFFLYWSNTS